MRVIIMVLNIKKSTLIRMGKKAGILLTMKNVKTAMIVFDKVTKRIDKLENDGHIKGSWNSGKKFTYIKKLNSKILSMI